jgi:predicted dehydrogenase
LTIATSQQYEVLIIGCGNIAGGFDIGRAPDQLPLSHAGAYTRHGGFRIRACVDPNSDRRKAFAQHWAVDEHATDLAMVSEGLRAFDVISVCSPTVMHHKHLECAMRLRPRVIFCEKPMTSDVVTTKRFARDCNSLGINLIVNYNRRWDPAVREFIDELHAGRWGKIRSVVGHYNKGILNNGSHMVDLLLQIVGPLRLVSTACVNFDCWDSDPTVGVLLTAASGKVPVYLNPGDARDFAYFEMEVVCELGVIRMLSSGMRWQVREVAPDPNYSGYKYLEESRQTQGRYLETMTYAVSRIYDYLQSGNLEVSLDDNTIKVQELCTQIQREALKKSSPKK